MMDGWKDRWSFWTSFWLAFMNEVTFWLLDVMSPLNMRQEKKAQLQIMFSFLRSFCLMSMSYWYFLGVHLKCYVKCSDLKYIEVDEKENVICFINDQRSSSMPSQTILLGLTAETPVFGRMNKFGMALWQQTPQKISCQLSHYSCCCFSWNMHSVDIFHLSM